MPNWIQALDERLLRWIGDSLRLPVLNSAVCFYSQLGDKGLLFIALALLMLCFAKTRRAGGTALTAMVLGLLVTNMTIKPLVSRDRPWIAMEDFETLIRNSDPNSFPSGHTCAAFAFAVAVCMTLPQRWARAAAVTVAILMGFSRLYVGVHFPSDVLVGAVIGSLCGLLASWLVPKMVDLFTEISQNNRKKESHHKSK
jgi:undecaprenyl-diphosphatase